MKEIVKRSVEESLCATREFFSAGCVERLIQCARLIVDSIKAGGKLIIAGNGGSCADAQHIAGEFINRFEVERSPLPAIAITTDTSVLTSISNDYEFEDVFSKQIRALGRRGDVFLAISTSGDSPNILRAVETAKDMGITTIALTGRDGGRLKEMAQLSFVVPASRTPRIQEVHTKFYHILCELVDHIMAQGGQAP